MEHYICAGTCKGVSDAPTKCGDKTCPLYDKAFESCNCTDGKHYGRQNPKGSTPPPSPVL